MVNLANIVWRALSGTQAHLATGTERSRRYAPGYSALIGFDDPRDPDWPGLAPYCEPGEKFYCAEWTGPVPEGWSLEIDASMFAMLWHGRAPEVDASVDAIRLGAVHVPQMTRLTTLTRPGPFAERTVEMGEWYGVFEGGQLIAMAGERMHVGNLREVSGICTHPDHQGRGLAKRLTNLVIRRQLGRGQMPFLHVASANTHALEIYRGMGFEVDREVAMRVISKQP